MLLASCMTDAQRRRYRLLAYASTWTGCMSEVLFDSSAIVLLFFTALGSGDAVTMFTTAFCPVAWSVLLIPCSELARKKGLKWGLNAGVYLGIAGIFLIVIAPLLGRWCIPAALTGYAVFAVSRPVHLAAWTPLLNGILRREERGGFFGFMRFSYQMIALILFSGVGFFMGAKPPLWVLQSVIGFCGLLLIGRKLCIDRIPAARSFGGQSIPFLIQLRSTVRNGALMSFSAYCCGIGIVICAVNPLTVLYLKNAVGIGSGQVQLVSVCGTAGIMAGYLSSGYLLKKFKVKKLLICAHLNFIFLLLALTCCVPQFKWTPVACGVLLLFQGFTAGIYTNCYSTEMLALAKPGHHTTSIAICSTYVSLGGALGKFSVSSALGSGILAGSWTKIGLTFTHYQTILLVCAVIGAILLVVLPTVPAVIPDREDYYDGAK